MKKNYFYIIASLLAIALIIGLSFVFIDGDLSNDVLTHTNEVFIPYLVAKIGFGVALIFITCWIFLVKKARGHALALLTATYALQFVPLLCRLGLLFAVNGAGKALVITYELLLVAILAIAYVIFLGLVYYQDKKMVASDEKYHGGTIEVVSEEESRRKEKGGDTIPVVSEEDK